MEVKGYNMPDELYYHKEHMWVKVEGDKAKVGITDFAQKLAGEISFIELPEEGDEVEKDSVVGSYETGKWLGKVYAPISGEVISVNEEVDDDPAIINEDPYGKGWLFEVKISDMSELDTLMKGEEAKNWLLEEINKHEEEQK